MATQSNSVRRMTRVKRWTFTLDNYTDEDVERMENVTDCYIKFVKRLREETQTEFLQGYVIFKKRISLLQAKVALGQRVCLSLLKGSLNENDHRLDRDDDEVEEYGDKGLKKQINNAWGTHVQEIHEAKMAYMEDENHALEDFTPTFVRYPRLESTCQKLKLSRQLVKLKENYQALKPWQDTLYTELQGPPNDRTVQWVYDPLGNTGKTWFAKFLVIQDGAIRFENAKSADIKYAYNGQRIVIFDFCRSLENQINYEAIESIKNGIFLSTKYESQMKVFASPHVCVFANFMADLTKLSEGRWDICEIVRDNDAAGNNNQIVHKFVHRR